MNTLHQEYPIKQHTPYILVVEDDPDDQLLLKIIFDKTTHNVSLQFVRNAYEAMDYLEQTPDHMLPHLIVADYSLPGRNGMALIHHLNNLERYKEIEKVILSNSLYFPGHGNIKQPLKNYFVKPYTFEGMKQLAEQLLQLCLVTV